MTSIIRTACLALVLPLAVSAEEGGDLSLTIGDSTAEFSLWAAQSDFSGSAQFGSVNIYSRGADGTDWGLFTLGFSVAGDTADLPEASLNPTDGATLFSQDEQGNLAVTIEALSLDGDFLSVSGAVSGQFGPSDNFGRDIDLSAPTPVEGRFAVTLGPVE